MSAKYGSRPRLRASCDGCFLAKVKCSKGRPICSRCLSVGLICQYSPSSRATSGAGGSGSGSGNGGNSRGRSSRQLMASTLSDESCEELGRWLNQQWPMMDQGVNTTGGLAPTMSALSTWHGAGPGSSTFSDTLSTTVPIRGVASNGADSIRNGSLPEHHSTLALTGWTLNQDPSLAHHRFGEMTNTAQNDPLQPAAWNGAFDQTSTMMSAYADQDTTERLRTQGWQNTTTPELTEWQLAYWQPEQFDCESSQLPSDAWHGGDFTNNHG
jgi:hypothetical protein